MWARGEGAMGKGEEGERETSSHLAHLLRHLAISPSRHPCHPCQLSRHVPRVTVRQSSVEGNERALLFFDPCLLIEFGRLGSFGPRDSRAL